MDSRVEQARRERDAAFNVLDACASAMRAAVENYNRVLDRYLDAAEEDKRGACACGMCVACGVKEWADEVHAKIVNAEKRVEGIGPHTSPRDSQGCACHWHQAECPGACPLAHAATHHATQPTQVHGNTALDTTSHG